jgi:AraC-like DNA-binding protein
MRMYFSLMPDRLDDCVFLHWRRDPDCRAVVDKRFVGYCSLQHIARGRVRLAYNARNWDLEPGWIWPCYPGPRIRFSALAPATAWTHRYVAMRGLLVDAWRSEGLLPEEPCPEPGGARVAQRFDEIHALLDAGDRWSRRRAVNALEALLLVLAQAVGRNEPGGWVAHAQAMLADERRFHADIDGVASACGMAPSTFRRRFHAAVGVSPRTWALHARLERARGLLLAGHEPVRLIAERLGYHDPFFFSRQFQAHTGLSPTAYRRSFQQP